MFEYSEPLPDFRAAARFALLVLFNLIKDLNRRTVCYDLGCALHDCR